MELELNTGKYVLAVSGGVDSIVLLDVLSKRSGVELIVAHFDHGIRQDSADDLKFVADKAKEYELKFVSDSGQLGESASEEDARNARYAFLKKAQKNLTADAIITAHHQDDVIETAIINILRGTNRKGLSSLRSTSDIRRPLLGWTKKDILNYARKNKLKWREDPTNKSDKYLRNHIRNNILPEFDEAQRIKFLNIIESQRRNNQEIDEQIFRLLRSSTSTRDIDRKFFSSLPHSLAKEFLAGFLRVNGVFFDAKSLERLCVALKTKPHKTSLDISGGWTFVIHKNHISLQAVKQV